VFHGDASHDWQKVMCGKATWVVQRAFTAVRYSAIIAINTLRLQLPVLHVDQHVLAQTGSIMRFIADISGKANHSIKGAQADSAFEAAQETNMTQIYVAVNLMEEEVAKAVAAKFKGQLPKYLTHWSRLLMDDKFFHGVLAIYCMQP
jgi:glutathione S-transferase